MIKSGTIQAVSLDNDLNDLTQDVAMVTIGIIAEGNPINGWIDSI